MFYPPIVYGPYAGLLGLKIVQFGIHFFSYPLHMTTTQSTLTRLGRSPTPNTLVLFLVFLSSSLCLSLSLVHLNNIVTNI